jgi:hypothetical protein
MARPVDASKYVEGDPCKRCGGTLYRRKTVCVECERRANARRYAERSGIDYVEPAPRLKISPTRLSSALDGYRRSPSARDRSRYLDALVLGKTPGEDESPKCAGDIWRGMLQRGALARHLPDYDSQVGERHAQNAALAKAIRRIRPRLPDIVGLDELRRLLPSDAVEPINPTRLPWAIAAVLAELGIVSGRGESTRLYIVRHKRRYAGLTNYALEQVKAGNRPPAARGRSSKSKIQGNAPGDRTATQRAFTGQREAPSRPPVTGCDNKGIRNGTRCLMVRPLSGRPAA